LVGGDLCVDQHETVGELSHPLANPLPVSTEEVKAVGLVARAFADKPGQFGAGGQRHARGAEEYAVAEPGDVPFAVYPQPGRVALYRTGEYPDALVEAQRVHAQAGSPSDFADTDTGGSHTPTIAV